MMAKTRREIFVTLIAWHFLLISPVFTQDAVVQYSIQEETEPNTFIGSVALDSKLFTEISSEKLKMLNFQILKEGNKNVDYFRIEEETSLLWTKSVIDREGFPECFETCLIEFNVAVFDLELADFIFVIKVTINVQDSNDNSPEFVNINNPVSVSEATTVGSLIVSGAAIDLDQGGNNSLQTYTLQSETDVFELKTVEVDANGKEFELYLKSSLDRESQLSYSLVIYAKDGGQPQRTGTLSLAIFVTDFNDNPPQFDQQLYNTSINENLDLQTTVLTFQALDKDFGENGRVSYKFSNRIADKILNVFSIDEFLGDLKTAGNVDYETDQEFAFEVVAYDHGDPTLSATVNVHISVNDVNDNSPSINLNQPPGGIVISELADVESFVTHLEIIDKDSGKNGQISCNLSDSHFKIEEVPGIENNYKIVLSKKLDHDEMANHNVTILCQDMGESPLTTVEYFTVHVEDVNDNSPVFTQNVYTVTVEENIDEGTSVLDVSASDKDSGTYGQVEYSLYSDSSGLFKINLFTGVIQTNVSLDREQHGEQIIFRVLAQDKGQPAHTATGTVVVNVKDLNDNAPNFDPDPLEFHVSENMPSGTLVGNISATDPDSGTNGTFYFEFPNDPDVLEYVSFNELGQIFTAKKFDREKTAVQRFTIGATDMGGLSSTVNVVIFVDDENDNYPEIIYPNEYDDKVSIAFSLPVSSEVLRIEARDYDIGDNAQLYYYIDHDNASYAFVLDVTTGKLFLNRSLHEKDIGEVFQFYIRVKDGGKSPLSAWTELNIIVIENHSGFLPQTDGTQHNLVIVIIIVVVTAVLSVTMILVIVKICWCGRRKKGTGSTSDIMEDSDLDPRYVDSLSATSNSSKDSNIDMKIKDGLQIQNEYSKDFYNKANEADYIKSTYIEQMKTLDLHKKLDETTSDNSCELGTRDSGQGGSDLDNISLSELPAFDASGSNGHETVGHVNGSSNSYFHNNRSLQLPSNSHHSNGYSEPISDCVIMPRSAVSFSHIPTKTAERKELGKLRSNKKVMFSFDLENSNSSGRSSTMSSQSIGDISYAPSDPSSPRRFTRMLSEDSAIDMSNRYSRANNWLRRSADNLKWQQISDKHYNQLPSNQIKFASSGDSTNRPMSSNIKTYLDKVMTRTRNSSVSDSKGDSLTLRSTGSNDVFMLSRSYYPSSNSQDTGSTTTSGSYHLVSKPYSLTSLSMESDNVFAEDIEV